MSPRRARHAASHRIPFAGVLILLVLVVGAGLAWRTGVVDVGSGVAPSPAPTPPSTPSPAPSPTSTLSAAPEPSPTSRPTPQPINTAFEGLTTFRGNATRSHYGRGPIPEDPVVRWRYPASGDLCSTSSDEHGPRLWCGTGWTGQPNVIVHDDGSVEVRVGAYDGAYHFLDGLTGEPVRPDLETGDLAKGSATSDPDGFPLYYAGSRDNLLRIVAMDRAAPTVLWTLDASTSVPNPVWNNDWDGAPLVIDGHLLVGGENSWFYVIELNRDYRPNGKVTVDPEVVLAVPGFDDDLLAAVGDRNVSIESSVAFHDGVAYFANSGGLVQGWDISRVLGGGKRARRVFRFWTGEDTDATVVIDEEGSLYVGSELERFTQRANEVGQLMKLDPGRPDDPLVWSVPITERGLEGAAGVWATPALDRDTVYVATNAGELLAVDRETGRERWRIRLVGPTWSSPVPVDGVLLQGDCAGTLHAFDVSGRPNREPPELWSLNLGGCIESTPAVWDGMIYVGTRGGAIFGIGDRRG